MKIQFLGATGGSVTGSCTYFHYERTNTRFLVDCGIFQGETHADHENARTFPFKPDQLKFILLTHAHTDHCGLLLRLYREKFRGKIFCTTATAKLTAIMLENLVSRNQKLYSKDDRNNIKNLNFSYIDQRNDFGLSRLIPIDNDLWIYFLRSAHILGSVSITISWTSRDNQPKSIVMSGDLGNNTKENPYQSLLGFRQSPFGHPDYMVVESTYGSRNRDDVAKSFDHRVSALARVVRETVFEKKKILLIPAFSLQRSQEILFDLYFIFRQRRNLLRGDYDRIFSDEKLSDLSNNQSWESKTHEKLLEIIRAMSPENQAKWGSSLDVNYDGTKHFLSYGSRFTINDVRDLLASACEEYPVDIILDSPLTHKITKVFREELKRPQIIKPGEALFCNGRMAEMFDVASKQEVDQIIDDIYSEAATGHQIPGNAVIRHELHFSIPDGTEQPRRGTILISGAASCDGGPIVKHLPTVLKQEGATILLTGYMPRDTVGEKIQNIEVTRKQANRAELESFDIEGQTISANDIKAEIKLMGDFYSGHADQNGLLDFIFKFRPSKNDKPVPMTVFLNHGSEPDRKCLEEIISSRTLAGEERKIRKVELPSKGVRWYDLDKGLWDESGEQNNQSDVIERLVAEQLRTNILLERLLKKLDQIYPDDSKTEGDR